MNRPIVAEDRSHAMRDDGTDHGWWYNTICAAALVALGAATVTTGRIGGRHGLAPITGDAAVTLGAVFVAAGLVLLWFSWRGRGR